MNQENHFNNGESLCQQEYRIFKAYQYWRDMIGYKWVKVGPEMHVRLAYHMKLKGWTEIESMNAAMLLSALLSMGIIQTKNNDLWIRARTQPIYVGPYFLFVPRRLTYLLYEYVRDEGISYVKRTIRKLKQIN
jgi:hypothetical protein